MFYLNFYSDLLKMLIAFKSKNKALSEYPGSYSERAQEIVCLVNTAG